MDIGTFVGLLIGAATLLGTVIGFFIKVGKMAAKIEAVAAEQVETKKEIDRLEARVEKAENTDAQVRELAAAVEHMGQRFADMTDRLAERISNAVENMGLEYKRVAEAVAMQHEHIRAQLDDMRAQLRRTGSARGR